MDISGAGLQHSWLNPQLLQNRSSKFDPGVPPGLTVSVTIQPFEHSFAH
jgi:hypothetical protein